MHRTILVFFLLLIPLIALPALAQQAGDEEEEESSVLYPNRSEAGFHYGGFLPLLIDGFDDYYSVWGLNYTHPLWGYHWEWGLNYVKEEDVELADLSGSLRFTYYLDNTLDLFVGLGVDVVRHQSGLDDEEVSIDAKVEPGAHIQFGLFGKMTDVLQFRGYFKYTFGPGQHLVAGIGLSMMFYGGEDDQEAE